MNIKTNGTQKESKVIDIPVTGKNEIMHYRVDYDTTNPESKLRVFVSEVKAMVNRYEQNDTRLKEIETELCDLEHYMEIAPLQSAPKGYKLYRKLRELRIERRACKNENDLLRPVYDYFHATTVITKLSAVSSEVSKTKAAINSRCYTIRTNALNEVFGPGGVSSEQFFGEDFKGMELGSEIKKWLEEA